MVVKYICSICGNESSNKENIENCEASHSIAEDYRIIRIHFVRSTPNVPYMIDVEHIETKKIFKYRLYM